jgi:threonine aldolase
MRFISAQFATLLADELWRRNAEHANQMAQLLARELEKISRIRITQPVESNGVFAIVPAKCIPILQQKYFFYVWNEETSEARFMTSFDTTTEDISNFIAHLRKVVG